jgi:hypothetical protein
VHCHVPCSTAARRYFSESFADQQHFLPTGRAFLLPALLPAACRAGEYISVSSQKDSEEADIEKERQEQLKGPEACQREFEELVKPCTYLFIQHTLVVAVLAS